MSLLAIFISLFVTWPLSAAAIYSPFSNATTLATIATIPTTTSTVVLNSSTFSTLNTNLQYGTISQSTVFLSSSATSEIPTTPQIPIPSSSTMAPPRSTTLAAVPIAPASIATASTTGPCLCQQAGTWCGFRSLTGELSGLCDPNTVYGCHQGGPAKPDTEAKCKSSKFIVMISKGVCENENRAFDTCT